MDEEQQEQWSILEQQGKPIKTDGKDITLLLLGETGVGKSTWINGFANFIQYETLSDAECNPTLCIIPTSFTMTDDNYEECIIRTGIYDKNEIMEIGQSATQKPQSYTFLNKDGNIIRLIDTPGIGDVRGVEQDKKNFQLILDHISYLDDLHGICILLKPNNARLNIMFTFCIKELLTHLHKDACRNIIFCFTNSRSTFYRPGDTLPALRKLIEENQKNNIHIPLNQSTLYCMDNESIRFLYALKNGIKFTPDERTNYITSWNKSVNEVDRLLKHISEQSPHSIQNTLSLNNARQTILALGSPLAEISRNIQINIANSEKKLNDLTMTKISKDELNKHLVIHEIGIRMDVLLIPRTICTAPKCVEYINNGFDTKINYITHCHGNCSRGKQKYYKISNVVGHKSLKKCSAFDRGGKCKNCGCSWKYHMKITYETNTEIKEIIDVKKQLEIGEKEMAIKNIENFLNVLDIHLKELKNEQNEITQASITFACFLKKNAITPYNDALIAYLTHFINEEKSKVNAGGDTKVLEGMEKMRENYKEQMDMLQQAMKDGKEDGVSTIDLEKCIENLYQLKHCGKSLQQMMNTSIYSATKNYTEKRIERTESFTTTTTTTTNNIKTNKKQGFFDQFQWPGSTTAVKKSSPKKLFENFRQPSIEKNNFKKMSQKRTTKPILENVKIQTAVFEKSAANNVRPVTPVTGGINQSKPTRPRLPPPALPPNKPLFSGSRLTASFTNTAPKQQHKTAPAPPPPHNTVPASPPPHNTAPAPPPLPPPLPPVMAVTDIPAKFPATATSTLLDQIQQKELKETEGGIKVDSSGLNDENGETKTIKSKKSNSSNDDMMDAIKRAILARGLNIQHSEQSDDENKEDDF